MLSKICSEIQKELKLTDEQMKYVQGKLMDYGVCVMVDSSVRKELDEAIHNKCKDVHW